jgi:hypothetical protein
MVSLNVISRLLLLGKKYSTESLEFSFQIKGCNLESKQAGSHRRR